ncbi:uncharacterized protein [Littorina saxatilis]|uniref:Uncharacterized protein n=1 Tax=Littorina saxatilis TaxID=31220 RepID=A0AAN9B287_9CAEN
MAVQKMSGSDDNFHGEDSQDTRSLDHYYDQDELREKIPTEVAPLYRQRQVLLKIGDSFLRIGMASKPAISKMKPPLYPAFNVTELERLTNPKGPPKKVSDNFNFHAFTFTADESATITESWYRHAKSFFHIRLGVNRHGPAGPVEYVSAFPGQTDNPFVQYDQRIYDAWWRLTAVAAGQFVAEPLYIPGRCLMHGRTGLCLSPPLTAREQGDISRGTWDKARTVSVITLPDFAVTRPGAYVD